MAIKITLSNLVKFKVIGTVNNENGPENFEFSLTAKRYSAESLKARLNDEEETKESFLLKEVTNWSGVKGDDGQDVPYSQEAFKQLLQIVGLTLLCFEVYMSEIGSKAKN